ncbi:MAG: LPS export ABC transporter permease LptG [Desulfobacterales bacterium]
MTLLSRYVTREVIKYVLLILLVISTIYMVADFVNKADEFIDVDLSLPELLFCFVAQMPLEQFVPVSVLLSILVVFGLMGRNNEILALKSSGVSDWKLAKSMLGIGIVVSLLLFIGSESVFPLIRSAANRVWLNAVEKERIVQKQKDVWIKEDRFIYHFRHHDPTSGKSFGIAINEFDADFRLVRRLNAESAVLIDGKWRLAGVMEQILDPVSGSFEVVIHDEVTWDRDLRLEDLASIAKSTEEMGLLELWDYVNKVDAEGYDTTAYRADLHAKLAFPVTGLMLCLLGSGIALGAERMLNLPMMVLIGIGSAFLFWVIRSFCISLAYGGMLNPIAAAWVPNLLFAGVGIYLLMRGR